MRYVFGGVYFVAIVLAMLSVGGCHDRAGVVTGPAVDCSVESTRRENPDVCRAPAQPE
jgi:hypothetical protein